LKSLEKVNWQRILYIISGAISLSCNYWRKKSHGCCGRPLSFML